MIMPPEEETTDRNEKRGEQKFNRQVECRGERDPDEPASAEIDEWHSRADPRLIILASDKRQASELRYLPGSVSCGSEESSYAGVTTLCQWPLIDGEKILSCQVLKRYGTELVAETGGVIVGTCTTTELHLGNIFMTLVSIQN